MSASAKRSPLPLPKLIQRGICLGLVFMHSALLSCGQSTSQLPQETAAQTLEMLIPPELLPLLTSLSHTYQSTHEQTVFLATGSPQQLASGIRADVLIVKNPNSVTIPENQINTTTPWIGERLVLIEQEDFPLTTTLELLPETQGTIAVVSDSQPIGLYARLALRVVGLWQPLETRVRHRVSPEAVLLHVTSNQDRFGILYASQIPPESPVRILTDLQLPESVHVRYTLIPLSDKGIKMTQWLVSEPILQQAELAGYAR